MSRSGKIVSKFDNLIEAFITDPNYKINVDGRIWSMYSKKVTKLVGRVHDKTRVGDKPKKYYKIYYRGKELLRSRIMYRVFKGELSSDLVVDHINTNSLDDHPDNLQLITQKKNITRIK